MKTQKLLQLYQAGRRDFRGQDLQGQSFKGQNLSQADFSDANIQGTNFSGAILIGAKFVKAQCGLQPYWTIILSIAAWVMAGISGLLAGVVGYGVGQIFNKDGPELVVVGWLSLGILIIFFLATYYKGISTGLSFLGIVVSLDITLLLVYAAILAITSTGIVSNAIFSGVALVFGVALGTGTVAVGSAINSATSIAISRVIATIFVTISIAISVAFGSAFIGVYIGDGLILNINKFAIHVGLAGAATGLFFGTIIGAISVETIIVGTRRAIRTLIISLSLVFSTSLALANIFNSLKTEPAAVTVAAEPAAVAVAVVIAVTSVLLGVYMGWQAIVGNPKYMLIHSAVLVLTVTGGTKFQGADLTDADFSDAQLTSTDLRDSILKRTRWQGAKNLDRLRPGNTYLQDTQVRQLVGTNDGRDKVFNYKNLRGVNLQGAQLTDASFVAADLSEANLQEADLTRAKLVQTQLDQTDLTGAYLTAACLEDWGITGDTKLHGVVCEYVFMRWVRPGDPNSNPRRKPDDWNEVFAAGDFAEFIKPIVDTLDLYHNQQVDPRAIAISFKKLTETHPNADLEIIAMEKRGDDKFLLRAKTTESADHSALSQTYFEIYNQVKRLVKQEVQSLLAEKVDQEQNLVDIVSEISQNLTNQKPSVNINAGGNIGTVGGITGGDVSGVINLGEIQAATNRAIHQFSDSSDSGQDGLQASLHRLQTVLTTEPTLSDTGRAIAMEQIQALAQAGHNSQSADMQQQAQQAINMLMVITSGMAEGARLVNVFNEVLPSITARFNLD